MAEISFDFRNIVGSKKSAVSLPRLVNLEIGDESPGSSSESSFQDFLINGRDCCNDVKYENNLNCEFDKQCDNNFLIHSQSVLSICTFDDRSSDKIKSANDSDINFNLLNLLNTSEIEREETGAENFNSMKNTPNDKMKIISNIEVSDGSSDIADEICEKDEVDATFKYQRKNAKDREIDLLDFNFHKNECADSLSSNNSSLKVEGNLSDLLSCINIEDSDVVKVGSFKSNSMCNSKLANKFETVKEPCVSDLSDLLSSIDSDDNKGASCNQCNISSTEVVKTDNSCLADLLSYTDIYKSTTEMESSKINLSDQLSSIDFEDSNNGCCNQANTCNTKIAETKRALCLAGGLSSLDINKSNMPTPAALNSNPLCFKDVNSPNNLLNDLTFDILSLSSSSDSYSSSYTDKENNSPKESLIENNLLADKVLEFDSSYGSFDSMHKEFSFFDYSSDNQFSLNTLLTNNTDNSIAMRNSKNEDPRNSNEEMSMSDLLTIVSPEFKSPMLATLNKTEKLAGCVNEGSSSMLDLIESLNINSKNSDSPVLNYSSVECDGKLINYDCVDSPLSKKVQSSMKTVDFEGDVFIGKDVLMDRSDYVNDDDKISSDDEQINFIDLRECIKSEKHQFTPTSPIKHYKNAENQYSECFSPNKILFCREDKSLSDSSQNRSNLFEFNNMSPVKNSRVNTKQTLFSKALACKPKKDHSLLQKVANIKNELLNSIINRPVFIDCDVPQPIMETVIQSDKCILSNMGRKSFGLNTSCDLQ